MTDRREQILCRLTELLGTIDGINLVARNRDEISEKSRPAIMLLDADESVEIGPDGAKPPRSPALISMTPEIYVILGATPEEVGSILNAFRARIIKAILTDETLSSLVGPNGQIRYDGCATGLSRGRSMEGEMGLSFSFIYPLIPAQL